MPSDQTTARGVLLLVEDDPDHAFLVQRRLQEQPHLDLDVVHLGTMVDAVARLGRGDVRCVVVDLTLPDARGLEAVLAVRAAAPDLPVVVLTGLDSDDLGRQAVQAGAQDYLVKGRHGPESVGRAVVFALERTQRQAAEQQQALLASRLQLVLEASAEGICGLDDEGRLAFANRAAAELLGASADALRGRVLHDFHLCDDPDAVCALATGLLAGDLSDAGEQRFRSLDGRTRVLEVRARPVPLPGASQALVVNLADVTDRRAAQTALAEREAQLVEAQQLARLGSWEHDLVSGAVEWSDELHHLTGLGRDEVPRDARAFEAYLSRVPEAEREVVRRVLTGWTAARPPASVAHRLVLPDGSERWFHCQAGATVDPSTGAPTRVVGSVQDVTEQRAAEEALAHQALHDALTGLPNRALLLDRLDRALAGSREGVVSVVFLDLDRFKWVNDSMDHAAGDELLVAVARRLSSGLRPQDTLARFGGDEFVLVCERLPGEVEALEVVTRLTALLDQPFTLGGRELTVTASMGLALAHAGEATTPEALIRDADTAMYRAKERGRARCEVFDEDMRHRATARLEVQQELQLALLDSQVHAWYQPVVDLTTGAVVGCEALARWLHPTRAVLQPGDFVPHAEETGLVVTLGGAILREACGQVAAWNRERCPGDQLTLSVNVSARQLSSGSLVETVAAALGDSGLEPSRLCLELTESVIMEDVETSGAVLGRVRALGARTGVDDFGTGYSSLAYLMSLPLDLLKVDRSFVTALDPDGSDDGAAAAIVRAVVALADALGLGVVAEGVETAAQLAALRSLGVGRAQGFLWGRAAPAAACAWARPPAARPPVPVPRPVPAPALALPGGAA